MGTAENHPPHPHQATYFNIQVYLPFHRRGREAQQEVGLLSPFLPGAPFAPHQPQMHPNPLRVPASVPSIPPLRPGRPMFCSLAFSGDVVKPTALDATLSSQEAQFPHL